MKVKIVSDGTPVGTTVINAETGEQLEYVMCISWKINYDERATATIVVKNVAIEAMIEHAGTYYLPHDESESNE